MLIDMNSEVARSETSKRSWTKPRRTGTGKVTGTSIQAAIRPRRATSIRLAGVCELMSHSGAEARGYQANDSGPPSNPCSALSIQRLIQPPIDPATVETSACAVAVPSSRVRPSIARICSSPG